jgi:heat-inducible transcriptional repressor
MLTPRQELILRKVVLAYQATVQPVASRTIAADPELHAGPSTVRHELAHLEEIGLLAHPHTSAGRVPTDSGLRYFVDRLLPERRGGESMRLATETLSQVTNLLAIVSAPPLETATIRHVEVLLLQPQIVMVVIITSTGGVSKRVLAFDAPVDRGLVNWAAEFLNEELVGLGLGARQLQSRIADPALPATERTFLERIRPAFTELAATAEDSLYVDGAARLLSEHRFQDLSQINELMRLLEGRVALLEILRHAVDERDVIVRIGTENTAPALRSLAMVSAAYGLPVRSLGTVSVIGPVAMDYGETIGIVRDAAAQLSRFVEELYAT